MRRVPLRIAALGLGLGLATGLGLGLAAAPAQGEPGVKPAAKPGPEKSGPDRNAPDKGGAAPLIGCPSLANYRMLMRPGAPAAAAVLADPKADHLGCTALPQGRITGISDRVALGGRSYECANVQGTTACHWMEASQMPAAAPGRGGAGR